MVKTRNEVHVVPGEEPSKVGGKGWFVKRVGEPESDHAWFTSKSAAIRSATSIAKNLKAELLVHNEDGQLGYRSSYGNDPARRKG